MKDFIKLSVLKSDDIYRIFSITDDIIAGGYNGFLNGKSAVMFFPASSIRTRVTFEKGIHLLGGQSILFPDGMLCSSWLHQLHMWLAYMTEIFSI